MRAMTFERLVRDERFVSELLTTSVGALGLDRPTGVRRADAHVDVAATAALLGTAHRQAVDHGRTTIITNLAVPFVGMESEPTATPVKPDFAIVATRRGVADPDAVDGSWLIMGDAKDYERVRSRIDDQRMLKGFLQVALGAESAAVWTQLPAGMEVHRSGALAVPRNAFLQPEAVVEVLDDHRREVRARADERTDLLAELGGGTVPTGGLDAYVSHLEADFDPQSCVSCSMFNYCRTELRASADPAALLVELGVRPEHRPALREYLHTGTPPEGVPDSLVAGLKATVDGFPVRTGQLRIDSAGEPGTIEIALVKADSAALGVHGVAIRRVQRDGMPTAWKVDVFADPQSPKTRIQLMRLIGAALEAAVRDHGRESSEAANSVHLVVPDTVTADVLVSIADSLAGVETSRLRWQRDREMGRPALTFNGEPARIPAALAKQARLAVSFFLEADRARAMNLRDPIIDLRAVLGGHFVPGGPAVDAGRLDYLVTWAEATAQMDHRQVSDAVAASEHTPGARLANVRSDDIHEAGRGRPTRRGRTRPDPARYDQLVRDELAYKQDLIERAITLLEGLGESRLSRAHRALERDAQEVWRRRLRFRASDLVRFGRTSDRWRDKHVELLDSDDACAQRLQALGNPQVALDIALDAGTRDVARATLTSTAPLRVVVDSRRIGDGSTMVVLHVDGQPVVESDDVTLNVLKGSFKFSRFSVGELTADRQTERGKGFLWDPVVPLNASVGAELVVADADWFNTFANGHQIAVKRPAMDDENAPKADCGPDSYHDHPDEHRYCCRPHEVAEAETADWLATRRARGEMNPQTWPPIVDDDEFDISAKGAPTAAETVDRVNDQPDPDLTVDDLD